MSSRRWFYAAGVTAAALIAASTATSLQGQAVRGVLPVPLPPPPALSQLVYPDINRLGLLDCQGAPTSGGRGLTLVGNIATACAQYTGFPITMPGQREKLVALGKALFWDMRVGSDGVQACASCHFHAGADNRAINQLSPGLHRFGSTNFQINAAVNPSQLAAAPDMALNRPANSTLSAADFPLAVPGLPGGNDGVTGTAALTNARAFGNNDVVSSQGVRLGTFTGISGPRVDDGPMASSDVPFMLSSVAQTARRVEPRNTPTAIGAGFYLRNFWDGRANQFFNGVNPFGMLDPNARVLVNNGGAVQPVQLMIPFSSLASQAVGPPGSDFEMSLAGRNLAHVAKKLWLDWPLAGQQVAADDSALGAYACHAGNTREECGANTAAHRQTGLGKSYAQFIQEIFQPKFWNGQTAGNVPLMEANFSLFFGLALQAYQATLVPDQTPLDPILAYMTPLLQQAAPLTSDQALARARLACAQDPGIRAGVVGAGVVNPDDAVAKCERLVDELTLFLNPIVVGAALNAQTGTGCAVCHVGAEFTGATVSMLTGFGRPVPAVAARPVVPEAIAAIERMVFADGQLKVYDSGFYNIGVRPTADDLGIFARTPGNVPFSIGMLMQEIARGNTAGDLGAVRTLLASGNLKQPAAAVGFPNYTVDLTPVPVTTFTPACAPRGAQQNGRAVGLVNGNGCQPVTTTEPIGIRGAFKTSTLRNNKLNGPFFHNGGRATVEDVIRAHYDRGGIFNLAFNPQNCRLNQKGVSSQTGCLAGQVDFDPGIVVLNLGSNGPIGLTASSSGRVGDQIKGLAHLIEFGLTDPRVERKMAPFDHPQLCVPVGHNADGSTSLAEIPAVGSTGSADRIQNFLGLPDASGGASGNGHALTGGSCTMPLTALGFTGATSARGAASVRP